MKKRKKKLYRAVVPVVVYYLSTEDEYEDDAVTYATEELRGNGIFGTKPQVIEVSRDHEPTADTQWHNHCLIYGANDVPSKEYDGELHLGEAIERFGS